MSDDDAYYERAGSWALDSRALASRSRRTAGVAVAVATLEALALAMLTPLKTVQPVTLLVDRQTGFVQALDPLEPRRVGADAALTQSFLAQYVTAREGFDRAIVLTDYRKVALWSADRARSDYVKTMPATNPASPLARYPAGTVVAVRVKSVSRLSQNTALVRFDTQRSDRTGRVETAQPWISVVRYRYVDAPMALEDRLVNPLGFQVWSYRRDAEAPPPVSAPARPITIGSAPHVAPMPQPAAPYAVARRTAVRRANVTSLADSPIPARQREVPLNQLPFGSPLVGIAR